MIRGLCGRFGCSKAWTSLDPSLAEPAQRNHTLARHGSRLISASPALRRHHHFPTRQLAAARVPPPTSSAFLRLLSLPLESLPASDLFIDLSAATVILRDPGPAAAASGRYCRARETDRCVSRAGTPPSAVVKCKAGRLWSLLKSFRAAGSVCDETALVLTP